MTRATPTGSDDVAQSRRGRIKLVTVHGTGAGNTDTRGERWWQLGSPFQVELAKRLELDPSKVEIVPFQWNIGPNSENSRRAAGLALHDKLKGYDRAGEDYHVIGHSHGGSVIYHALLHSVATGKPLERLKCWCTVGTPFLEYRPHRLLFNRLGGVGLTLYVISLCAIILATVLTVKFLLGTAPFDAAIVLYFGLGAGVLLAYGVACLLIVYKYESYWGGVQSQSDKDTAVDLYANRWIGLWHRDDEAISALSNIRLVDAELVPTDFLVPFASVLPVLITVIASLSAALFINPQQLYEWTLMFVFILSQGFFIGYTSAPFVAVLQYFFIALLFFCASVAGFVAIGLPAVALVKKLAKLVGSPISRLINGSVWSSVRRQAWGADRGNEGVARISAHPPRFAAKCSPLPDAIGDELSRLSEKNAVLTLFKLREILGMTREPKTSADIRTQLSEQLTWKELIHTAYFDVPQFVDLVAICFNHAGLSDLKLDLWTTSDRDAASAWYRDISNPETKVQTAAA